MSLIIKNQSLRWKGLVECDKCHGINDEEDCTKCHGEGEFMLDCDLIYDIYPGVPPTISGPPEHCDPGEGAYVAKLTVFHNDVDITERVRDIEAADDFIINYWENLD